MKKQIQIQKGNNQNVEQNSNETTFRIQANVCLDDAFVTEYKNA